MYVTQTAEEEEVTEEIIFSFCFDELLSQHKEKRKYCEIENFHFFSPTVIDNLPRS